MTSRKPLGNLDLGNLAETSLTSRQPRGNLSEPSLPFKKRSLVVGMSSLPACCPSTLPRIFQSGKHAGGLAERFAGNFAKDIGRRYAPSGLPMVFPTTYPAETLCLTIKVKISVRTAPPQTIYIYIIYIPLPTTRDLLKGRLGKTKHMNKFMLHNAKRQQGTLFLLRMGKSNIGNSKCMQTYTHKA